MLTSAYRKSLFADRKRIYADRIRARYPLEVGERLEEQGLRLLVQPRVREAKRYVPHLLVQRR